MLKYVREKMKIRKQAAVITASAAPFSIGFCIIAVLATAQSSATQSDLGKTEAYIHAAVEQSGFYQTSGPHGEYLSERDHIVFGGCQVTLHVFAVSLDDPIYKKESINLDIIFNLKDLDPKVVAAPEDLNDNKLPDNREWVILRTADRNESIMILRDKKIVSAISAYPLPGSANHAENQKLADAFARAVTICRQKP
jgi:hypothetical protein